MPYCFYNYTSIYRLRKLQNNVDDLQFATSLTRLIDSNIPQLQIGHLKIQGAALNLQGLSTIAANAPIFSAAPPIFIAWIPVVCFFLLKIAINTNFRTLNLHIRQTKVLSFHCLLPTIVPTTLHKYVYLARQMSRTNGLQRV